MVFRQHQAADSKNKADDQTLQLLRRMVIKGMDAAAIDSLLLDNRCQLQGAEVVEEGRPLLGVAVEDDHSILCARDGGVQMLQLL